MWNKYKNKKTIVDGIRFDSKREAQRYLQLKTMLEVGAIKGLELQKKYILIPTQKEDGKVIERECFYKADFVYNENGYTVVEDAKGMRTPEYIIKRKLMLQVYGIRIKEI